jgi:hypothetical protein
MRRAFVFLLVVAVPVVCLADAPPAPQPSAPVIKVKVSSKPAPGRALKYTLLPPLLERTSGNAASFWLRASGAAREVQQKWTDDVYKWMGSTGTPLKDLPVKEVRDFLDKYRLALRLTEEAARRDHCDWDRPPLTLQTLGEGLFLNEVQSQRQLAGLLSIRFRLELAEKHTDQALSTLQTGFALAHDIGEAPTLLDNLVAIAVTAIMESHVEELLEQPDAPNLYWALTTLPRPFLDLRKPLEYEFGTLYRSVPQLRDLDKKTLTADQAQDLLDYLLRQMVEFEGVGKAGAKNWPLPRADKKQVAELIEKLYPDAKQHLRDRGRTAEQVAALPKVQAVGIYLVDRYDHDRDEVMKWFAVPPWQARAGLEQVEKRLRAERERGPGNLFVSLLFPAVEKVHAAGTRVERYLAGLRCVEAIRRYAAAHDGKLPARLEDVTEVPLPLDPATGKGFDAFYKADGDTAVLEIPPPPGKEGQSPILGRRYEFSRPGK